MNSEPKPIIPFLAPVYALTRQLAYPAFRLTLAGFMLTHAYASGKITGTTTVAQFADVLVKRGMEPALPLAYLVFFTEIICSVLLALGLFTRFAATAMLIELAVIANEAFWQRGFWYNRNGGGAELICFWALMLVIILMRGCGPLSVDRKIGWEL